MNVRNSEEIQVLLDHPRGAGVVVSCYADTSVTEGFASHWSAHLKAEATRVREELAGSPESLEEFERQLAMIRQALESEVARHAHGVAIFGASGWEQPMVLPSDEPYQSRLVVDEEPYLVPLLVADANRREYLVVLTDTHRGRLYAAEPGEVRLLDELDESIPQKNRSSGQRWGKDQATIARHREDHILHYLKELGRRVERAWDLHRYQGIVLLGEHEVLEDFRGHLPKRLSDRIVHEAPHAWAGKQPEIRDQVREVVDSAIAVERDRLLREIARRLEEGFAVATGPQEVIVALGNGQVLDLVLGPDTGEIASRCSGCQSLFAFVERTCPYCKSPCATTNLWQEILSLALRHGVTVLYVAATPGVVVPGGVAALLARDETQWAPAAIASPETTGRGD